MARRYTVRSRSDHRFPNALLNGDPRDKFDATFLSNLNFLVHTPWYDRIDVIYLEGVSLRSLVPVDQQNIDGLFVPTIFAIDSDADCLCLDCDFGHF